MEQQCCQLSLGQIWACRPNQRLTDRWLDGCGMPEHSKVTAVHFFVQPGTNHTQCFNEQGVK